MLYIHTYLSICLTRSGMKKVSLWSENTPQTNQNYLCHKETVKKVFSSLDMWRQKNIFFAMVFTIKLRNSFHRSRKNMEVYMRLFSIIVLLMISYASSEEGVKIYNSEPTATITSHSRGVELQEGMEYTFIGQVSDGNHNYSELSVSWSFNARSLCEENTPNVDGQPS